LFLIENLKAKGIEWKLGSNGKDLHLLFYGEENELKKRNKTIEYRLRK